MLTPQDVLLVNQEFVLDVIALNTRFTIQHLLDVLVSMDISNIIQPFPQILLVLLAL